MTQHIQFDLFEPVNELSILRMEIASLREEVNALRKSQFARLNALGKLIIDNKNEKKGKKDE